MPKTAHSPRKYAPIFTSTTQHLKRKIPDSDNNISAVDGNAITDPKRVCAYVNMGDSWANSEETNLMGFHSVPINSDKNKRPVDDTNANGEVGSAEVKNVMIFRL